MTFTTGGGEVLKQDSRGRIRYTPERREELLAEFEKSSLPGAKFAALIGVKSSTFAGWRTRAGVLAQNPNLVLLRQACVTTKNPVGVVGGEDFRWQAC